MEARIINLIKAGESTGNSSKLRNLKWKRNVLRTALYEKLKLWKEGKLVEETPSYADLNKHREMK
jgi:hypothetical protein